MNCKDVALSIESPYVFYGNNKNGDFVSRFLYADDSIILSTTSKLFKVLKDDTDTWCLYINDCSYLMPSSCRCKPYILPLDISIGDDTVKCEYSVYITSVSNVENAVSMVGSYDKPIVLHVNNLPIVDDYGRTPCDDKFNPEIANLNFHLLLINKSDNIHAEHSSFETRFCQMFYNSIVISPVYKAAELFSDGDDIIIKVKTGVDEFGRNIYDVHNTTKYPDGTIGPIKIRRVQQDNTLTLEMPVDFKLCLCDNDFVVELANTEVCNEIPLDAVKINTDDGTVSFMPDDTMFPKDSTGKEVCGVSKLYLSRGGCDEPLAASEITILRYKYDGSKVDGKYTTGANCIYASEVKLNYESTDLDGNDNSNGVYGKTIYVKIKNRKNCCNMVYNRVRTKYKDYLGYRHGEMTLNGILCREGDIVWLAAQYSDAYDNEGNQIDGNGLWIVHANSDWRFYGPVTDDMFIDLGASVKDEVALTYGNPVTRKYGNYWLGGKYLSSGTVVNLQNQEDANGLYRVTCGDWEYLGDAGNYYGNMIDGTDDIVTYNDIDFCQCGIYHIWYYYLNNACVLNSNSRTVKVVGKCNGKDGTLVPGKRIRITDYRIHTEVDDELLGKNNDTDIDKCIQNTESFDSQFRVDLVDIANNCVGPLITPSCTEELVCDHLYWLNSNTETNKYSSSDNSGFSMVFWKYEDAHWVMYGLVGNTATKDKSYVAYKLDTYGFATQDMVNVSDWFIPHDVESFPAKYNDKLKNITFDISETEQQFNVGDKIVVVDDGIVSKSYGAEITSISDTGVVSALMDSSSDVLGKKLMVIKSDYVFVVDGMVISDASWMFAKSTRYKIDIIGESYKSGVINYNEDNVSREISIAGKYSKGIITYNPNETVFNIGQSLMTCSNEVNKLSISAVVTDIEVVDDNTYKAYLKFAEKVPQKTVNVYDGGEVKSYKTPVDMYTVVDNALTADTIMDNWSINTNTTEIFIPKSYDFRFYNTSISVAEFVDIYNSYGKWKCITQPVQHIVLTTDDSTYESPEILTTDSSYIIELEENLVNK